MSRKNLIDLGQAATLLGMSAGEVRELVDSGQIPHVKVGPFLRFDAEALRALFGETIDDPPDNPPPKWDDVPP